MRRNSKKAWRKTPGNRLEYPERAVEEGLVNALIHRNDLELGNEFHIDMYDDRLEIYSPGGLVDSVSIKDIDMMNMASRRRNPVLADIFSRLKYMERRDSGFKKIMSAYKGHDGYTKDMNPTFSTPWDSFVLVLTKFNIDGVEGVYINSDDVTDYGGQTGGQTSVDTTIAEVLRLIKENPQITRKVLSETIGVASSAIQKHINRLKAEGVIRRVGGDYGGYWEVIK